MIRCTIHRDEAEQRADRYLRRLLPGAQLGYVFKLFRQKKVRVNGSRAAQNTMLREGDELELRIPVGLFERLRGEVAPAEEGGGAAGPLEIVHRDDDVLAVLKPAGVLVQPGPGAHGPDLTTRVRRRFAAEYAERPFAPSPAHRLDLETSGLVLFGMSPAGLRGLAAALRAREVDKRYLALVQGRPEGSEGVIELALREGQGRKGTPKSVPGSGRAARTDWRMVAAGPAHALLALRLHTGRMHQIRAHLAAQGLPIVGDLRYGARPEPRLGLPPRTLMLHAAALRLVHPVSGEGLDLVARLPELFRTVGGSVGVGPEGDGGEE